LIVCVTAAAACFLFPFLRRSTDEQSAAQLRLVADAVNQIQKIDQVAAQITGATHQWNEFHRQAGQVSDSTKSLAASIAGEAKAFTEFLQKANEGEKGRLRLEVDKLRRAETEWVHALILMLDHVFALSLAARRSGQPNLIEQVGQFQHSCRETARRVGLCAMAGCDGEPFDPKLHQLRDQTVPDENAVVAETLLPGYTFQGQLARRAVVALKSPVQTELAEDPA
jgi:molecular chaperone GrpE (heat shock protein)